MARVNDHSSNRSFVRLENPPFLGSVLAKELLLVGFSFFSVGVYLAHSTPPTGYELSIYTATPIGFWICIAVAGLTATTTAVYGNDGRLRLLSFLLLGISVVSIVSLPIVRGYYFYGTADPLTHLGWSRSIATGEMAATQLKYPAIHVIGVMVHAALGIPLPRALLFAVAAPAIVFLLFIPHSIRRITAHPRVIAIAVLSAALFLPINNLSVHLRAHPFTQTTLFSALVVFLLLAYVVDGDVSSGLLSVTPMDGLLLTATAASILFHPQQALNLLLVFVLVSVAQVVVRWRRPEHPIARNRLLLVQTIAFGVMYAAWISTTDWFAPIATRHTNEMIGFFLGYGDPADRIASQGSSLQAIGASLPEIFVKLFLVQSVFVLLAGILALAAISGRLSNRNPRERAVILYLTVAIGGVGVVTAVYLFGSIREMYFRHIGAAMVFVTILGVLALDRALTAFSPSVTTRRSALIVFFVVALSLQTATVYQSPYIYKHSQHVTEMELTGYETAFEHQNEGVTFVGIRGGPNRYADATYGGEGRTTDYGETITGAEIEAGIAQQAGSDRYLVVTRTDREREVVAYRGLRYSQAHFESIGVQPGVNRVQSNGELDVFYVTAAEET